MSNRDINLRGITHYWDPGEDDRLKILKVAKGIPRGAVDEVLDAMWKVISTQRRTKLIGWGVFEWKPWRRKLPTGRRVETWTLTISPSRYIKKYKGRTKHARTH